MPQANCGVAPAAAAVVVWAVAVAVVLAATLAMAVRLVPASLWLRPVRRERLSHPASVALAAAALQLARVATAAGQVLPEHLGRILGLRLARPGDLLASQSTASAL